MHVKWGEKDGGEQRLTVKAFWFTLVILQGETKYSSFLAYLRNPPPFIAFTVHSATYLLPVFSIADLIEVPASRQDGLQAYLCDVEHLGWPIVTSLPDVNNCVWKNLGEGGKR